VFTLTVDDAFATLTCMAGPDRADPFSRSYALGAPGPIATGRKLGVPMPGQRIFFGDRRSATAYEKVVARCADLGIAVVEIDIEPFYETARLLYEGPWVAERYITMRSLIASSPESMHPVTREIVLAGARPSAVDAFAAFYQLEDLRRVSDHVFRQVDALILPTIPTAYTVEQVLADPVQLNSRLGTYTNFVNLLDLCGLAVPAAMHNDGTPFGVTLLAPAGSDAMLASIGRVLHADTGLPLGALGCAQPRLAQLPAVPLADEIAIAVVGAHLSGMPLNGELRALGGRLLEMTTTAPDYRLYALAGTNPPKPGLLRIAEGEGTPIAVEVWAVSTNAFGRFVAAVPAPLSIGTITLADGRSAKGFLVEAQAVAGGCDISEFGGWRAFMAEKQRAVGGR
jgi:allophanate hydrolase